MAIQVLPRVTATYSVVYPLLLSESRSMSCWSRSEDMMEKSPREAGIESGASSLLESAQVEAPCSRRHLTMSVLLREMAWQRGASQSLLRSSVLAPFCTNLWAIYFSSAPTTMFSMLSCPFGLRLGSAPWSSKMSI